MGKTDVLSFSGCSFQEPVFDLSLGKQGRKPFNHQVWISMLFKISMGACQQTFLSIGTADGGRNNSKSCFVKMRPQPIYPNEHIVTGNI